ncbi:hypothetical protein [Candidatus Vondammii sp. HM_W22]|uniref:hypothetical protein n=1 Tax=Candidatus Vondammii sp. HM_W22 TaxID=2687299 RepID=UPI001F1425D3|nr:hypothetical protein [Candidatus Vondammii sp. HM_W22]
MQLAELFPIQDESANKMALTGRVDIKLAMQGRGSGIRKGDWDIYFAALGFSDADADYLGEGVGGEWNGTFSQKNTQWKGHHSLIVEKGKILTSSLYLAPEGSEIILQSDYHLSENSERLSLSGFSFNHPNILNLTASAVLGLGENFSIIQLQAKTGVSDLARLFSAYFQPVLADPLFEEIELAGQVRLELEIDGIRETRVKIELDDIYLEQGKESSESVGGQFALYGLDGTLNWTTRNESESESYLRWEGGTLLGGIDIGPAELFITLGEQRIVLGRPAAIPLLDGKLMAEKFVSIQRESGAELRFQGYLTPISMERFSQAMGWPTLAGQLSGMIPGVSYQSGVINVDGVALVKMFGGSILIQNLQLDDLFGALPALDADIELKELDLETLTKTFSFGKITGKLEGRIDNLRLEDWQPISFDAWFATPVDDDSRHRISQKAVDNISNLDGSGVSGALSRSFLRFFDEFGYTRLGIKCKLEEGICDMGGIESTERGYYLVKGGGIPRIDIIGFNTKTDWNLLLSKLQQIASGSAPVIE